MEVGDQLRIYPGCHKQVLEDCRDRFRIPGSLLFDKGNVRNFGASRTCPAARSRPCRRPRLMPSELTSSIGRLGLIAAGGYAFGPIGAAAGRCSAASVRLQRTKIEARALATSDVSSSAYGG